MSTAFDALFGGGNIKKEIERDIFFPSPVQVTC